MANTIKLQGISGQQEGTSTKNLKIGDVIVWNYGMKSEVVEIIPSKTGKTITFMLKSHQDGEIRSRKMGAERLVVVEKKQQEEPEKSTKRNTHRQTSGAGSASPPTAIEIKFKEDMKNERNHDNY